MSQPVVLVCEECVRQRDRIIGLYRPDSEKQTMPYQCSRDGERREANHKHPAIAVEVRNVRT